MVHKNQNTLHVQLILNKVKLSGCVFYRLCQRVYEIQGLTKSRIKGLDTKRRYIFLLLKAMVCSLENAGTTVNAVGTGPRNTRSSKGICMVEKPVKAKVEITIKGHNEWICMGYSIKLSTLGCQRFANLANPWPGHCSNISQKALFWFGLSNLPVALSLGC